MNATGEIVDQADIHTVTLPGATTDISEENSKHLREEIPKSETHMAEDAEILLVDSSNEVTADSESFSEERAGNDIRVFRYYFKFVNWKRAVIFVVFQVCLAFLSSFPGLFNLLSFYDCLFVTKKGQFNIL